MKRRYIIIFVLLGILFGGICAILILKETSAKIITEVDQLHNGDAKLYRNQIITSVEGKFTVYDKKGEMIKQFPDIATNWIDCMDEEGIIVYGNGACQIGILQVDDEWNVVKNEIVMQTDNLQIDPTITKVKDTYYITATEIIGTVNNSDPDAENGEYILHLYKSADLLHWNLVSNIVDVNNNVEDVDMRYIDDKFYITYEKEVVDKGDSAIYVVISDDASGKQFSTSYRLLEANCDHEPATFEQMDNSVYRLYYSCDKNHRGESYQGAQVFYADYDSDWNPISTDNPVKTQTEQGILLYDVKNVKGNLQLLYARNYMTDCDMVVEKVR